MQNSQIMTSNNISRPKQYLNAGEIAISKKPEIIWTDLGSCVSIVMYNKRLKISALCHAQLPQKLNSSYKCSSTCIKPCFYEVAPENRFKFVSCTVKYLIEEFNKLGIKNNEILTGLYGGSSIYENKALEETVGGKNIILAKKLIRTSKLRLVKTDVGGIRSRRIYHYTDIGKTTIAFFNPIRNKYN